jgi:hypothetical protein
MLQQPEQVLWDVRHEALLYVFPADDGRSAKLAVVVNYSLKKKGIVNAARTAFKVESKDIADGIKGGMYEVVR